MFRSPRTSLQSALSLWIEGGSPDEILAALPRRSSPKSHRLASWAHGAAGDRASAWEEARAADLASQPFWIRPWIRRLLSRVPNAEDEAQWNRCRTLLRWAPRSGHLWHRWAVLHTMAGDASGFLDALEAGLPWVLEDPMVLEHLLLQTHQHLETVGPDRPHTFSALRRFADRLESLLLHRHGDPRLGWDRARVALAHLHRGDPLRALTLLWPIPPHRRTLPQWEVLVMTLRHLDRPNEVRDLLDHILKGSPGSFRLWMERHLLDLHEGRTEEALEALKRAQDFLPPEEMGLAEARGEWILRRAAYAFFVENDAPEAWDLLQRLPPEAPDDHRPPLRVQVRLALGDAEGAYAALRPLLREHPEDLDLRLAEADCLAGLGAWDTLTEHLADLPDKAQARADYWHLKGLAAAHRQEWLPAREALERAASMAPGDLRLVLDAGHACMDLQEYDRAETHWRQALRLDPQCAEALVQLAESLHLRHDTEGAKRLLRECLLHHPDHADAQSFLAELEAH